MNRHLICNQKQCMSNAVRHERHQASSDAMSVFHIEAITTFKPSRIIDKMSVNRCHQHTSSIVAGFQRALLSFSISLALMPSTKSCEMWHIWCSKRKSVSKTFANDMFLAAFTCLNTIFWDVGEPLQAKHEILGSQSTQDYCGMLAW